MPFEADHDEAPATILDPAGAVSPIIVPDVGVTPDTFRGFMSWEDRLRNTQEKLKSLSNGFPFLSRGDA